MPSRGNGKPAPPQVDMWCWAGASPQLAFLALPACFDGRPCRERARFARGAGCGHRGATQYCSLSGVLVASADLSSRRLDFLSCFQQSSLFRMRVFQGGCQSCTAPLVWWLILVRESSTMETVRRMQNKWGKPNKLSSAFTKQAWPPPDLFQGTFLKLILKKNPSGAAPGSHREVSSHRQSQVGDGALFLSFIY